MTSLQLLAALGWSLVAIESALSRANGRGDRSFVRIAAAGGALFIAALAGSGALK